MIVFWYWFGYQLLYKRIPTNWDRFAFVMISHIVTMPLHVQITLSHFAMSTADLGARESFPQKMLRTTMDVDCPQWLDFVHGGLQFQVSCHSAFIISSDEDDLALLSGVFHSPTESTGNKSPCLCARNTKGDREDRGCHSHGRLGGT